MTPSETAAAPLRPALALQTQSANQTRDLAATLAGVARPGDRLALIGPLGAGKTQFAKGFAAGLGVSSVVNSPSFTLMAEHAGRLPLFHQDLYRLGGAADAIAGGLFDERQDAGVTLSEWADRLESGFDPERLEVRISVLGDEERRIGLLAPAGNRYDRYLDVAAAWEPDQEPSR
jgi:tRNA threonylcarbamoyladenosine biosynthesis protein TsaE